MSKSIKKVIKKRSSSYSIQRFDRDSGYYDENDGIWVDDAEVTQTISMHIQPIVDTLIDGVPAQRQLATWHGWAIDETGNEVANKDIITVTSELFTVSNLVYWPGVYREFDLTRSGEADNIDDT
jgi:hypothetical protein